MKKIFLVFIIMFLVGCVSRAATFKTATFVGKDYNEVFDAALAVLQANFEIETSNRESGIIETAYYTKARDASPARIPKVILSLTETPDNLYNLRWRATAKVYKSAQGADVSIQVKKEREDSAAMVSMSLKDIDSPQTGPRCVRAPSPCLLSRMRPSCYNALRYQHETTPEPG